MLYVYQVHRLEIVLCQVAGMIPGTSCTPMHYQWYKYRVCRFPTCTADRASLDLGNCDTSYLVRSPGTRYLGTVTRYQLPGTLYRYVLKKMPLLKTVRTCVPSLKKVLIVRVITTSRHIIANDCEQ